MLHNKKINTPNYILITAILIIISCNSNNKMTSHLEYDVFVFSDVCKYYVIDTEEIGYFNEDYCKFKNPVLKDYNLISPFLPANKESILIANKMNGVAKYNLTKRILNTVEFDKALNKNTSIYYFNKKIVSVNLDSNIVEVYENKDSLFQNKFEIRISDEDIFNLYGGINSSKVLIESGYFPSGGCEYINYHSLNLDDYSYTDITEKILPINHPESPFDIYYMDINQGYMFFPHVKRVRDFSWEEEDDYILDANFDTVGRALSKRIYYNNNGYKIDKENNIEFYYFSIDDEKYVCLPINIEFERQIYKTYYDKKLNKQELKSLTDIEIELLKNTIILKRDGIIKSNKIKDILSVYTFSANYEELLPKKRVVESLAGIAKENYALLGSIK